MVVAACEGARGGNAAYGTLEGLAQRDAITERAARKLSLGRESLLSDGATFSRPDLTPKAVADAAMAGDAVALETFEEVAHYVGLGVANCINIFNPEIVAIARRDRSSRRFADENHYPLGKVNAIPTLFATCRIALGALGDNAGIMGAAALIEHETNSRR